MRLVFIFIAVLIIGCKAFQKVDRDELYYYHHCVHYGKCFTSIIDTIYKEASKKGYYKILSSESSYKKFKIKRSQDSLIIPHNTKGYLNLPTWTLHNKYYNQDCIPPLTIACQWDQIVKQKDDSVYHLTVYDPDSFWIDKGVEYLYVEMDKGDYVLCSYHRQIVCPKDLWGQTMRKACFKLRKLGYIDECNSSIYDGKLKKALQNFQIDIGLDTNFVYIEALDDLGIEREKWEDRLWDKDNRAQNMIK